MATLPASITHLRAQNGTIYMLLKHYSQNDDQEPSLYTVGTLLRVYTHSGIPEERLGNTKIMLPFPGSGHDTAVQVRTFHMVEVPWEYISLVQNVKKESRVDFFMDKINLEEVNSIRPHSEIVIHNRRGVVDGTEGTVLYIGEIDGSLGTSFGVEQSPKYHEPLGFTDGFYRHIRYFSCEEDCGFFLHPNQLQPKKRKYNLKIAVGERVVVQMDNAELATVKWIGFLPDEQSRNPDDIKVGVEFDRAVGSGTGRYGGKQLFFAKKKHASLVHILGLLKESEFLGMGMSINSEVILRSQHLNCTQAINEFNADQRECNLPDDINSPQMLQRVAYAAMPSATSVSEYAAMGLRPKTSAKTHVTQMSCTEADDETCPPQKVVSGQSQHGTLIPRSFELQFGGDAPSLHKPVTFTASSKYKLEVGCRVAVFSDPPHFGTIRWIGTLSKPKPVIAGIEMDVPNPRSYTSGFFNGKHIFKCKEHSAFFVNIEKVVPCSSPDVHLSKTDGAVANVFSSVGMYQGIQGETNSCYMDVSVFALFRYASLLDDILQPREENEADSEVRIALRDIVELLRRDSYVKGARMLTFRNALSKRCPGKEFETQERDPEEFLTCLFNDALKHPPFLKLNTGHESYFYQLFMGKSDKLVSPTTQQLIHASFLESNIKLVETPFLLMLQMPRFGKTFKMYDYILPSPLMEITDLLESYPRPCWICDQLATLECPSCYDATYDSFEKITFCESCFQDKHNKHSLSQHKGRALFSDAKGINQLRKNKDEQIERVFMELFAIICIEISHYVCFVKTDDFSEEHSPSWVFFNSMADRQGFADLSHNIPQVVKCPEVTQWFEEFGEHTPWQVVTAMDTGSGHSTNRIKRMLTDSSLCLYRLSRKVGKKE